MLVQLVEAPERRLRMTELAERGAALRSGLTRLVDRLEREGLVRREACDSDARGLFTVLTDAGLERLREASPVHLRGVAAAQRVGRRVDDPRPAGAARDLAPARSAPARPHPHWRRRSGPTLGTPALHVGSSAC